MSHLSSQSFREEMTLEIARGATSTFMRDDGAEAGQGLSAGTITSNMCLSIIGTTVIGIGFQMSKGGWVLSPVLLCIGCGIIGEMTRLASRTIDHLQAQARADGRDTEVKAYSDYAELAFGPRGRLLSSLTSTLALLGMVCGGLLVVSKNLQYSAPIGERTDDGGRQVWVIIMSTTTAIYAFADIAPLLKRAAVIGPLVCVGCIFLAVYAGIDALTQLQEFPEECRNGPHGEPYTNVWPQVTGSGVDLVLAIAQIMAYGFYCFAVVVTVPSLKGQMRNPSEVVSASALAYVICTVMFLVIMILTYGGFGNLGPESIIDGMQHNRPSGWWALSKPWQTGEGTIMGQIFSWMLIVNLLLTDVIYVPCTVLAIEGWCPSLFESSRTARICSRVLLVLFRMVVAAFVKGFIDLTGLTSSAFCVCNNILLPTAAYYKTGTYKRDNTGVLRMMLHGMMFAFGIFVLICGTLGSLKNILFPPASANVPVGDFPRTLPFGTTAACEAAYHAAVGGNSSAWSVVMF